MLERILARLGRSQQRYLADELAQLKLRLGSIETRLLRAIAVDRLRDAEFTVFSQFGEDGIIQFLIHRVDIPDHARTFAEFGVAAYTECNTRFLLEHDGWSGIAVDADAAHVRTIANSSLRWRHTIDAVQAFVTRENAPAILSAAGFERDFGLLSIDLDGNDYWVWHDLGGFAPRIVVVEYNSTFGPHKAVSVPYDERFQRDRAHPSHLYWGASLAALVALAAEKGYRFVGSNSAGNNAFFVREDVAGSLPACDAAEEWVPSRFRESRGPDGALTYVTSISERRELIADMPVVDVTTGELLRVRDLSNPA